VTYPNPYINRTAAKCLQVTCNHAGVVYGDKAMDDDGNRLGITMHSFRHTRITKWVEAGYSDEIIRMASGHKSLDSYRKYVHLDPSAVMRLVSPSEPKTVQKRNISKVGNA